MSYWGISRSTRRDDDVAKSHLAPTSSVGRALKPPARTLCTRVDRSTTLTAKTGTRMRPTPERQNAMRSAAQQQSTTHRRKNSDALLLRVHEVQLAGPPPHILERLDAAHVVHKYNTCNHVVKALQRAAAVPRTPLPHFSVQPSSAAVKAASAGQSRAEQSALMPHSTHRKHCCKRRSDWSRTCGGRRRRRLQ
jgi:hypothetical protein